MHLEEQYKEQDKGHKSTTAKQLVLATTIEVVGQKSLVTTLNTARIQCAASLTSQNAPPTMWAGHLERENSGFSV
jgi:hypothetical protein